jgi:hypothetical protein
MSMPIPPANESRWDIEFDLEDSTTVLRFSGRLRGPLSIALRERVLSAV